MADNKSLLDKVGNKKKTLDSKKEFLTPEALSSLECSRHSSPQSSVGDTTDCEADVESNMSEEPAPLKSTDKKTEKLSPFHTFLCCGSLFLVLVIAATFLFLPVKSPKSTAKAETLTSYMQNKSFIFQDQKACLNMQSIDNQVMLVLHRTDSKTCRLIDIDIMSGTFAITNKMMLQPLQMICLSSLQCFSIFQNGYIQSTSLRTTNRKVCFNIQSASLISFINKDDIMLSCINQNKKTYFKILSVRNFKILFTIKVAERFQFFRFVVSKNRSKQKNVLVIMKMQRSMDLYKFSLIKNNSFLFGERATLITRNIDITNNVIHTDINRDGRLDLLFATISRHVLGIDGETLVPLFVFKVISQDFKRFGSVYINNAFYLSILKKQEKMRNTCARFMMEIIDVRNKTTLLAIPLSKLPDTLTNDEISTSFLFWQDQTLQSCQRRKDLTTSSNHTHKFYRDHHKTVKVYQEMVKLRVLYPATKSVSKQPRLKKREYNPMYEAVEKEGTDLHSFNRMKSPAGHITTIKEFSDDEKHADFLNLANCITKLQTEFLNGIRAAVILFFGANEDNSSPNSKEHRIQKLGHWKQRRRRHDQKANSENVVLSDLLTGNVEVFRLVREQPETKFKSHMKTNYRTKRNIVEKTKETSICRSQNLLSLRLSFEKNDIMHTWKLHKTRSNCIETKGRVIESFMIKDDVILTRFEYYDSSGDDGRFKGTEIRWDTIT